MQSPFIAVSHKDFKVKIHQIIFLYVALKKRVWDAATVEYHWNIITVPITISSLKFNRLRFTTTHIYNQGCFKEIDWHALHTIQ